MPVRTRQAASTDIDIALQPKQARLFQLIEATGPDVATWVGYGGARGGGKSAAIRRVMLARRLKHPGTVGCIVRRVFGDAKVNHIDPFLAEYPSLAPYYRVGDHELLLPNKSKIAFAYAETKAEVDRKFWGPEYADIFVDQAEQFTGGELTTIKTANRWPGAKPGFCKMGLFFNPGGAGTEFLRRVFWLKQYQKQERATDYAFIQAYGWDNFEWLRGTGMISTKEFYELSDDARFEIFIRHSQYGRELNALPPSLRAGHLMGSFESFAGQYYAGVWDESKCLLTMDQCERLIQPWWNRWSSTDWGFAHNAAHIWFATGKVSPQQFSEAFGGTTAYPVDVVIAYRELVTSQTGEAELAQMIADMTPVEERRLLRHEFLSPDAWAKRGSANTIQEQLGEVWAREKLPLPDRADDDRVGGWRMLYHGFRQTCAMLADEKREDQARVGPMLLISANCAQVIASIPLLIRDENNLEDVLKTNTIADDVGDCLRYGYKSMMDPKSKAPADVRALEVWNSKPDPTDRAIAMLQFRQKEARNLAIRQPRRGR